MKYDPYVKRYISKEDYIKECYGGLPNESMLEEQWNALPDHPEKMKDPKNIIRLSSHTYELPCFEVGMSGLRYHSSQGISFCKGSKDTPVHPGFITESLIQLCKMHLESVNQGELENKFTTTAIEHLQAALWNLEERQKDRQDRGVAQTYQK